MTSLLKCATLQFFHLAVFVGSTETAVWPIFFLPYDSFLLLKDLKNYSY